MDPLATPTSPLPIHSLVQPNPGNPRGEEHLSVDTTINKGAVQQTQGLVDECLEPAKTAPLQLAELKQAAHSFYEVDDDSNTILEKAGGKQEPQIDTMPAFSSLRPKMSRLPQSLERGKAYSVDALYTTARLPALDDLGLALWQALHLLHPVCTNYAGSFTTRPPRNVPSTLSVDGSTCKEEAEHKTAVDIVRQVFNWEEIKLAEHLSGSFHGVVFRSMRAQDSESMSLYEADRSAHEEAVASGGLLMYWYGVPDQDGMNLATCVWRDRESSVAASALPMHREAVKHARKAYKTFELSRYRIEKRIGETGLHISAPP